jgi:hypothetical protein
MEIDYPPHALTSTDGTGRGGRRTEGRIHGPSGCRVMYSGQLRNNRWCLQYNMIKVTESRDNTQERVQSTERTTTNNINHKIVSFVILREL